MDSNLHIVIGAGATGTATATLLAAEGATVKVVTRSGSGPTAPGIELVNADASDQNRLTQIATGAYAIYNCANPPYNTWTTDWPPLAASLLGTAEATGARLVTLSNLYGYAVPTAPMKATDPLDPPSVKGGVRTAMWHDALEWHQAGRIQMTEVRASDFIGPNIGQNGRMADRLVPRLLKGKSVSLMGDPDMPHSWTSIADVARALVTLGADDRALGRAWHVPSAPAASQRDLVHQLSVLAGIDPVKISIMPSIALRIVGLFMPVVRELREVAYQFEVPFVIDSQDTTDVFGLTYTPIEETLRATLASYGHTNGSNVHVHR